MNFWSETIFVVFVIAMVLTGFLIPRILLIAFRRKLFDAPDKRKIHRGVIPRLGGFAFLPSVLCAVVLAIGWCLKFYDGAAVRMIASGPGVAALFLLCSQMFLYLVGIADDLVGMRYRGKFMVQICCALLTLLSGIWLPGLYGLLGIHAVPLWLGGLITAFMVVYIVNAVNLIDGIDGLASGLSIMALAFYGILFYMDGGFLYSMIAWGTAGALVTFFYYNVFGKSSRKTKIFMGDTGSLTVGMVLAFLSLEVACHPARNAFRGVALQDFNPLVLAFSPLIVPLFDVVRVFLHRVKKRRNPFLPDRSHIHHKLLAMGLSSRAALWLILGTALLFTAANVWLSAIADINIIVGLDVAVWVVGNILLTSAIRRRERRLGQRLFD